MELTEGPCTNANPVTGSKNQKFEFRSRLQLRRIDVHINQLYNRPHTHTHTEKHAQTVSGRAAVYSGAYGGVAVSRQSVKCGFVVAPLAPYPRCCVEFCKSSGNATEKKKQSTEFGESGKPGQENGTGNANHTDDDDDPVEKHNQVEESKVEVLMWHKCVGDYVCVCYAAP